MISIHWVIHGQSTNSPRITYPSKKKRPLLTRIIHWFPLIRPAIQPLFLRGYVRAGRLTSHISVFADVLELFPSIEISKSKNCRVVSHEFLCFTNSFSSCSNRTSMEQANYRLVNQLFCVNISSSICSKVDCSDLHSVKGATVDGSEILLTSWGW